MYGDLPESPLLYLSYSKYEIHMTSQTTHSQTAEESRDADAILYNG